MQQTSHQTIRLSRGRHIAPTEGACVMELASMLAGETFSDHPRSACPVISMVLRCYNDGIDDDRRQDLYWCAAAVVGTRSSADRAERTRRAADFFGVPLSPWLKIAPWTARRVIGQAAMCYARTAGEREHRAFLDFMAEMVGASAYAPAEITPDRPQPRRAAA